MVSTRLDRRISLLIALPVCLALGACESSGSYRVGAVGPAGATGAAGPQGPEGPAGAQGPAGPANPVIGGVLVKSGGLVNVVADKTLLLANAVDSKLPGGTNLVGTVVGVVKSTGVALVQTGNGQQYLLDGLAAAPGELVTATIGKATAIGSPGASPLIGASILSPGQTNGSLLTVGVGSNGNLVTLQPGGGGNLLGGLGGAAPGTATPGSGAGNLVGTLTSTVGTTVGGVVGQAGGSGTEKGGLVSGVTQGVGRRPPRSNRGARRYPRPATGLSPSPILTLHHPRRHAPRRRAAPTSRSARSASSGQASPPMLPRQPSPISAALPRPKI